VVECGGGGSTSTIGSAAPRMGLVVCDMAHWQLGTVERALLVEQQGKPALP
jgi:hypothetical protein